MPQLPPLLIATRGSRRKTAAYWRLPRRGKDVALVGIRPDLRGRQPRLSLTTGRI